MSAEKDPFFHTLRLPQFLAMSMLGSLPLQKITEFADAYRRNGDLSPLPTDTTAPAEVPGP